MPGDDYALWIHVPAGFAASQAVARTRAGQQVAARQSLTGDSLKIVFPGTQEAVEWEAPFVIATGRP